MQTFVPSPVTPEAYLDSRRLSKQRVEGAQILGVLLKLQITTSGCASREPRGWVKHPAVLMWRGHEEALCDYTIRVCEEHVRRGYVDRLAPVLRTLPRDGRYPLWWGDERVHASHRAALLDKAEWAFFERGDAQTLEWYASFNWRDKPRIAYHWPSIG